MRRFPRRILGYSGDNGAATSAELSAARVLARDAADNIYIADHSNGVIRKVTMTTGILSTVAGGGTGIDGGPATSAWINFPDGVALNTAGNIYISETTGASVNRIRFVSP